MKRIILAIWALNCLAGGGASQTATPKSIDSYCKEVDTLQKRHRTPELIFADTAGMEDKKEKWRSFGSEKALEKFREKSETYTIAYSWRRAGKIIASNFTLFSGSGDWAKYNNHCFREDGSLARLESDYRTFMNDFKVLRKRYFDATGRAIGSSVRYLDLTTGKPKAAKEGVMGDHPKEVDYYKKTSKLPFAHLVKQK